MKAAVFSYFINTKYSIFLINIHKNKKDVYDQGIIFPSEIIEISFSEKKKISNFYFFFTVKKKYIYLYIYI